MKSSNDEAPILIVSADDFGLTARVSQGIIEAHERGVVTSTSVIAVAPAFRSSAKQLRDVSSLGVGAHFTAVGEDPPLLSAREVPSLVDKRGNFWPTWKAFLPRKGLSSIECLYEGAPTGVNLATVQAFVSLPPNEVASHSPPRKISESPESKARVFNRRAHGVRTQRSELEIPVVVPSVAIAFGVIW